jgi:TRAP-type C4-dicarboxylate transport system permease small subunit
MESNGWVSRMERFARVFSQRLEWVGVIGLLLMFFANLVDVVGAKFLLWPLPGSIEIIAFAQIVAIAPAIAFTLFLGRHIRIESVMMMLPKRLRAVLGTFTSFFAFLTFAFLIWQSYLYGQSLRSAGEIGSTSRIPFYPFAYLIAFCSIPVCLAFLVEVFKSVAEVFRHGSR